FFAYCAYPLCSPPFPTRRSSDLTFSYALSLLRTEIIHELELPKHGFMPLQMPSTFAPTDDGDYLFLGKDKNENLHEIARHSPHRSEEHTSELQSRENLVCRLLLE